MLMYGTRLLFQLQFAKPIDVLPCRLDTVDFAFNYLYLISTIRSNLKLPDCQQWNAAESVEALNGMIDISV